MSEWRKLPLESCMEAIIDYRGKTPTKTDAGIPLITAKIIKSGRIEEPSEFIALEDYDSWMVRGLPRPGDVVLTTEAPLGEVAQLDDRKVALAQRVITLRGKKGFLDNTYLKFLFQTQFVRSQLEGRASGSTVTGIKQSELRKVLLPIPPMSEQLNIARILGDLDDKIELNRQSNQTLEQMAQLIFNSWFVDFDPVKAKIEANAEGRDPERAAMCAISGKSDNELDKFPADQRQQLVATAALFPDELMESEIGMIPKGWSLISLYDSATFINGTAFNTKDFSLKQEGLPIIKIAELKSGISDQTKFTESTFPQKYHIDNHDVLYSWSGSPNTSLEVFKWFGGKGWLNQHIFKVVTKTNAAKYFVFYLLRLLKPRLVAIATDKQTTGLGHVTLADMKRLKIAYPDKAILNDYERIVGPLYEEGSQIEIQSYTLKNIRDELLPVLLSEGFAKATTTVSARDVK